MKITQHTPAPWFIEKHEMGLGIRYHDNGLRSHVADLYDSALCEEHGDIESNARLIAAAPLMLDALQGCITEEGATCFARDRKDYMKRRLDAISEIARAAIAQATGKVQP